jgi:hypothetical protein
MLLYSFGVCAFILLFAQMILFVKLTEHRTDIRRGQSPGAGAFPIGLVNVLRPSNYTGKGRSLLRRLYWLQVAWAVTLIGLLTQL